MTAILASFLGASGAAASNGFKRAASAVRSVPPAAVVGGLAAVAGVARADGAVAIDTTAVVATITSGVTTVSAIGIAVLSLVVVIKLFKWVQRTL